MLRSFLQLVAILGCSHLLPSAHASTASDSDTSGCGKFHFGGLTTRHEIKSSRLSRSYTAHVPLGYDKHKQYPLIVGFHGSDSIGFFFEADTRLDSSRFTADKIMLYPDGVGGSWAGPSYHNGTTVQEDLQFVSDMLSDVKTKYCIDSARIYATGISNGGGFVGTLACDKSTGGQFAAFAPASGSFYTDSGPVNDGCSPARSPLPILEFHGGADQTVKYDGGEGEGGYEPPIMSWLSFWAERNGCRTPPEERSSFGGDVHHYSWTCNGHAGVLQHYKVDDMKHVWPSKKPNFSQLAAGDKPTHIEASEIIQRFFDAYERPA